MTTQRRHRPAAKRATASITEHLETVREMWLEGVIDSEGFAILQNNMTYKTKTGRRVPKAVPSLAHAAAVVLRIEDWRDTDWLPRRRALEMVTCMDIVRGGRKLNLDGRDPTTFDSPLYRRAFAAAPMEYNRDLINLADDPEFIVREALWERDDLPFNTRQRMAVEFE